VKILLLKGANRAIRNNFNSLPIDFINDKEQDKELKHFLAPPSY